jgi:hypothetical protein
MSYDPHVDIDETNHDSWMEVIRFCPFTLKQDSFLVTRTRDGLIHGESVNGSSINAEDQEGFLREYRRTEMVYMHIRDLYREHKSYVKIPPGVVDPSKLFESKDADAVDNKISIYAAREAADKDVPTWK